MELYDDCVSFDFEVVAVYGPRTLRAVHIPLNRVRSVDNRSFWRSIQMLVDHGPWTVQLPFAKSTKVSVRVGSTEEGERFVAAMREHLAEDKAPCVHPGTPTISHDPALQTKRIRVKRQNPKSWQGTGERGERAQTMSKDSLLSS